MVLLATLSILLTVFVYYLHINKVCFIESEQMDMKHKGEMKHDENVHSVNHHYNISVQLMDLQGETTQWVFQWALWTPAQITLTPPLF